MIFWRLFVSFLKVGAFSFGGGYAALPLIRDEVVIHNHWLAANEFNDLITISQMTPGPIAINSATFVGLRVAGFGGAITATLGSVLPACVIVTLLAMLYNKYRQLESLQTILTTLRPAVVAMIAGAGVFILQAAFWGDKAFTINNFNWEMLFIFIICFTLLRKTKANPIYIMLLGGLLNIGWQILLK